METLFPEKEISKRRFSVSDQDVLSIFRRLGQFWFFDGLPLDIDFGQQGNKYLIYGGLLVGDHKPRESHCLGFIEINNVSRHNNIPVDVRLVCSWPPSIGFWEELDSILQREFKEVPFMSIPDNEGNGSVYMKKRGRPREKAYDLAYDRIIGKGLSLHDAYLLFCQEGELEKDLHGWEAFQVAIRRRRHKPTK